MYRIEADERPIAVATQALFSCASRNSKRIFVPLNQAGGDRLQSPVFLVHSISGAAGTDFFDLAARLGSSRKLYGVQAPRVNFKNPDFGGSIDTIAEFYADALDKFYPEGDIHLGGWSVGAIIALEMAQKLAERGRHIAVLVAIDLAPEHVPGALPPWSPRYLFEVVDNIPRALAYRLFVERSLFAKAGAGFARRAKAASRHLNALRGAEAYDAAWPTPGHPVKALTSFDLFPREQQAFMVRLYDAAIAYQARPYAGKAVVYHASVAPLFKNPQVARKWRAIAPNADIVKVYGTHASIVAEPFVIGVAEDLKRRLSEGPSAIAPRRLHLRSAPIANPRPARAS